MKLKPCPFCGGTTVTITGTDYGTNQMRYFVHCECGVRGPIFTYRVFAAEGWNQMCRKEE